MEVIVKNLQNYYHSYENMSKGDLIGDLGNPDISGIDTTKYLYYIVSHSVANINQTFSDIQKARHFALDFDAKNKANGYETYNIDNIVGLVEENEKI